MPHSPKREKDLLSAVVGGNIRLTEALAYFSRTGTNPDYEASELGLRRLEVDELIRLRKISSQEIVWLDDEVLQNPDDYEVVFNGYGYVEREMCKVNEDSLASEVHEITKNRFKVAIEAKSLLGVDGEQDGVATLVERARAFTHQFAFHLVNRKYAAVFGMFSEYLRSRESEGDIKKEIEKREKTYGDFGIFDHVEVQNVYNGPNGWKAELDADWWPKETVKEARRAVSSFELGSLVTPGGIIIEGYMMSLSIVEEDDLLRVQSYRLYSGN